MATRSPYANGIEGLDAVKKAKRPSFQDLSERASKMADTANHPPTTEEEEVVIVIPENLPTGINMGGPSPHTGEVSNRSKEHDNFDPLAPFETASLEPGLYPATKAAGAPPPPAPPKPCPTCEFYKDRIKVEMSLDAGNFIVHAIDVRETQFCITIMVPNDGGTVFIPKPGTQLTLHSPQVKGVVFFPGTYANYEELGVMVLAFVKADGDSDSGGINR